MLKIQRASSDALESPGLAAFKLPPQIIDRAVEGLAWISIFTAVTSVALTLIEHVLQPEVAAAWSNPLPPLVSAGIFVLSVGFLIIQWQGWLSKPHLLDAAMVYQVAIAFGCGLLEGAAYKNPNAVVIGHSSIAVWMILCGLLMPNAPLRVAISGVLCVASWPLAYWIDLRVFGYAPMPASRLLIWVLPLVIIAIWMIILNHRIISFYVKEQRAEEIGSYSLDTRLGYGGMGEVWRAKHKSLARDAAVKLIRNEVLYGSTVRHENLLRKRFEREAQATASLRSPHTVALYDFGSTRDGSFYYVMELLDGVDLQTLVDRFGPMDSARVIHVLHQVCQSLEEAHSAGLVHRDIKPRNILLCKLGLEYDFAKVLDFGLVKNLRPDSFDSALSTMDGATTGTPAYLAPEAAMGEKEIDGRADLYSLGCTAYFMLTGRMVFEDLTPTALAIAHVQKTPPPMRERTDLPIPARLEAIVMQLLEKDPADRIPSAAELARRLRGLRDVTQWCPDRAARWWELNLPELSRKLDQPSADLMASPAGMQVHA